MTVSPQKVQAGCSYSPRPPLPPVHAAPCPPGGLGSSAGRSSSQARERLKEKGSCDAFQAETRNQLDLLDDFFRQDDSKKKAESTFAQSPILFEPDPFSLFSSSSENLRLPPGDRQPASSFASNEKHAGLLTAGPSSSRASREGESVGSPGDMRVRIVGKGATSHFNSTGVHTSDTEKKSSLVSGAHSAQDLLSSEIEFFPSSSPPPPATTASATTLLLPPSSSPLLPLEQLVSPVRGLQQGEERAFHSSQAGLTTSTTDARPLVPPLGVRAEEGRVGRGREDEEEEERQESSRRRQRTTRSRRREQEESGEASPLKITLEDLYYALSERVLFTEDSGNRFYVILSLEEAEGVRVALHLTREKKSSSLIDGHRCAVALRNLSARFQVLDASPLFFKKKEKVSRGKHSCS